MDENTKKILLSAAKAAGIAHDGAGFVSASGLPINWNPYESDGDLLGLARKLRISIDYSESCAWCVYNGNKIVRFFGIEHRNKNDAQAIVSVAAAIFNAMP